MYASTWPQHASMPAPPVRQRAVGRLALEVGLAGGRTRIVNVGEGGPCRVRLPNVTSPGIEAVMMNTGGGIACGDSMTMNFAAGKGSDLVMTTPAAERCYRSDGAVSTVDVALRVEAGARLSWLPQETILYDHARLARRFTADVADDGTLTMFEALVFGRAAMGEIVTEGSLRDVWRVRRGGRLIYADTFNVSGPVHDLLQRPAIGGGNRALATLLHVAPDAQPRLEEARAALDDAAPDGAKCACAASAWNGMLAVRFLAPDVGTLRRAAMAFMTVFLGRPLPRVWHS